MFQIYKGKKVFLTGHTGFKGAWLSEWLLSLGAELCGYSIDIPTQPSQFELLELSSRMKDIRADIRDYVKLKESISKFQPDIVFHLAAQPLVRLSYDQPLETFAVNTMGTVNVLEAARHCPSIQAVVIVTTDKCYENRGWEFGYREIDPMGGHDPYSASKGAAEIVVSSYARSFFQGPGTKVCSARAGNVIGGGDWALDRIVPDSMRAWGKKEKVSIRNPKSIRPWQHVLEPLGAYLLLGKFLLEKKDSVAGEGFNFGPGSELDRSTLELVQELERHWPGCEHAIAETKDAKKEASMLRLNCDKALSRLRWKSLLPFHETAEWTATWYKTYFTSQKEAMQCTRKQIAAYEQRMERELQ